MEKLLSGKALTTAIALLDKNLKNTIATIEHLAQSACVEAVKSGNVTPLNKLAKATEHIGSRALMRWIAKHAPVSYDRETESFVINNDKREKAKEDIEAYAKEVTEAPGFVASAPKSDANPFSDFNLNEQIKRLIAKADKVKADDARKGKAKDDLRGLEALREFFGSLPVNMKAEAGKAAPKSKSGKGKHVKLTANTETVATA